MLHTVRGRSSISSSICLYKSEQVRTLRHAVGVIITLEDYNDTPPWTRLPVSSVIKQLLFAEALYMRRVCRCVRAHYSGVCVRGKHSSEQVEDDIVCVIHRKLFT